MNKKMKTILKKIATYIMILITIVTSLHTNSITTYADSELSYEKTIYSYEIISGVTDELVPQVNIHILKMDGEIVFCAESHILVSEGTGFLSETFIHEKREELEKIVYYGYTNTDKTDYDYAVVQLMIWEALGDQLLTTDVPDYHQRKAEILSLIADHNILPSWNDQVFTLVVGDSITIPDLNGIVSGMLLESNNTNALISKDGNNITITTDENTNGGVGSVTYRKVSDSSIGTSVIYRKQDEQSTIKLLMSDPKVASFTLNIERLGNAILVKEDSVTGAIPQGGASLDGAVYELRRASNDELIATVVTKDGKASVDLLELDSYYWIEVKAPEGYLLDNQRYYFTLEYQGESTTRVEHTTIVKEVVIKGGFAIVKFGNYDWRDFLAVYFGDKEIKPLENVEFSVYNDATGDLMAVGLTDSQGYLKFTDLPYGTYTVKETKVPEGYTASKDFKVMIDEENKIYHYIVENKVIEERLRVVKVDQETGNIIARSNAGFQIKSLQFGELVSMPKFNEDGQTDTFFTNNDGYLLTSERLPYGEYELIEIQAPEGYVLAKEPVKFVVDGSNDGLVEIEFENLSQKGVINFTKKGQTPIGVTTKNTDYGEMYEFLYDYEPMPGFTYQIKALEDIVTNDGTTRALAGEIVATLITNEFGEWESPELYLGKYQILEIAAPNGYIIDDTPIEVELIYAGQLVDLVFEQLMATNDFQTLDIQLFKDDEAIKTWENNMPIIENIASNGKVFGIFSRDDYELNGEIIVPQDSLLAFGSTIDGRVFYELKLPEGKYYLKELEAGEFHLKDELEYEFEFTAENNHLSFPINIYQDRVLYGRETLLRMKYKPLLNSLHFNEFVISKVNEQATFDKDKGFIFDYDFLGTGAVFALENELGEIIQEVIIDEEGKGYFKNIPVGVFYLKEKTPSSDSYVLSKEIIKIESTKSGIRAFNEADLLIGEQLVTEELEILFELKNLLKKGTAELTKTDVSTGELLPNTGVRVLDENHNILVEGRTDAQGSFIFKELPKGIYYFQEFDPPVGYELDDTPIKFEIKEDGEIIKANMTNRKIGPNTSDGTNNIMFFVMSFLLSLLVLIYSISMRNKEKNKLTH